jgi:hypothetical protein
MMNNSSINQMNYQIDLNLGKLVNITSETDIIWWLQIIGLINNRKVKVVYNYGRDSVIQRVLYGDKKVRLFMSGQKKPILINYDELAYWEKIRENPNTNTDLGENISYYDKKISFITDDYTLLLDEIETLNVFGIINQTKAKIEILNSKFGKDSYLGLNFIVDKLVVTNKFNPDIVGEIHIDAPDLLSRLDISKINLINVLPIETRGVINNINYNYLTNGYIISYIFKNEEVIVDFSFKMVDWKGIANNKTVWGLHSAGVYINYALSIKRDGIIIGNKKITKNIANCIVYLDVLMC